MRNTACRKREIFKKPECCHRYYEFGSLMICVWRRHEESCIVLFDQHAWRSFLPFYIKDVISLFWAFKLNISDVFKLNDIFFWLLINLDTLLNWITKSKIMFWTTSVTFVWILQNLSRWRKYIRKTDCTFIL